MKNSTKIIIGSAVVATTAVAVTKYYKEKKRKESNAISASGTGFPKKIDREIFLNSNTLVLGSTGSGKTHFYTIPMILRTENSYVINDPHGCVYGQTADALKNAGYNVQIMDLNALGAYDPFDYFINDDDVLCFAEEFVNITEPSPSIDPFWVSIKTSLLQAVMLYVWFHSSKKTMLTVREIIEKGPDFLDTLFNLFNEKCNSTDKDIQLCHLYHSFANNTKRIKETIYIRLITNLVVFKPLKCHTKICLENFADNKHALFVKVNFHDQNSSLMADLFYSQILARIREDQRMIMKNGNFEGESVRFLFDDCGSLKTLKNISGDRSLNIHHSVFAQSASQLRTLLGGDNWFRAVTINCPVSVLFSAPIFGEDEEFYTDVLDGDTLKLSNLERDEVLVRTAPLPPIKVKKSTLLL